MDDIQDMQFESQVPAAAATWELRAFIIQSLGYLVGVLDRCPAKVGQCVSQQAQSCAKMKEED
ncbi:hypothetical protein [Aliiglaciecola litoralis]|uniref:Uncharacterized protein n=1 Tax=Aliiglaciecola litoralis TaxID=582857 RepID=A0ABN1LGN6_9ALTE